MELQQSYLGDAPSVGFAQRSITNDFPSGSRWIDGMETVRLHEASPTTVGKPDGLNEITRSYELQSMQYGRLCAVLSSSVCLIEREQLFKRQHSYTQVVAFPNHVGSTAVENHAFNQLFAFDGFMKINEFWTLDKMYTPQPIEWQPPQAVFTEKNAQLNEMQLALLCRYWHMASNRAFHANTQPLECVCVVPKNATTEEEAIACGKELFMQLLAPYLPKAVGNIASMSAGVYLKTLGYYHPTALAVMVHEGELTSGSRFFDMRNNSYDHLTQNEADFIRAVVYRQPSSGLEEMYRRYCDIAGQRTRENCSFMADYHVAYIVWYLENSRYQGSAEDAVSKLRSLSNILKQSHQLTQEQTDAVMSHLEAVVFSVGLKQEIMSADNFKYLMVQVTKAPDHVAKEQMKLLALHEKHRQEPSFLKAWPTSNLNHQRLGEVMEYILMNGYINPPLGEKERDDLAQTNFIKYCKERAPVANAMGTYLRAYSNRYPEQGLFMLPLTKQFLEGGDMLAQSLRLLTAGYTEQMPDQTLLEGIKSAEQYMDENNQELLAEYYLECFRKHRSAPLAIKPTVDSIGSDTTRALCLVFADEAQKAGQQQPLSKEKIKETFDTFARHCKNPETVRSQYLVMVKAILDQSIQSGQNRFEWLCQNAELTQLMDVRSAHRMAADYLCSFACSTNKAADDQSFAAVTEWLKADGIVNEYAAHMNTMLDRLQPQTRNQALRTFGTFGSVEQYPNLRKVLLEGVREHLIKRWDETGKYWEAIDNLAGFMRLGNLSLQEVGTGDERVTSRGITLLTRIMSTTENQEDFRILLEKGASRPESPFKMLWFQQLRTTFCMKYNQVFSVCTTAEDVRRLHLQVNNLNLANEIQSKEGYQNGRMALAVEELLIQKSRNQIDNRSFYERSIQLSRYINQQRSTQTFFALRNIMVNLAVQYGNCDFHSKFLILLLPSDTMEPKQAAAYLLENLLTWNDDILRKPWADENVVQIQKIAYIIDTTSRRDSNRIELAQAIVDTLVYADPYQKYTERIRKDRKSILTYYPDMNNGGNVYTRAHAPEFRRWLGGNL